MTEEKPVGRNVWLVPPPQEEDEEAHVSVDSEERPAVIGMPLEGSTDEEELPDELPFEPPKGSEFKFRGIDSDTDELMAKLSIARPGRSEAAGQSTTADHGFTQKDQEELNGNLLADEILGSESGDEISADAGHEELEAAPPEDNSAIVAQEPKQPEVIVIGVPEEEPAEPAPQIISISSDKQTFNTPGEDEVEAVADTYLGKHRQVSWMQRVVDNLKTYVPGAKEQIREKSQLARRLGASAVAAVQTDRTKNFVSTLPARLYNTLNDIDDKFRVSKEKGWTTRRKVMAGAILGVMAVGTAYVIYKGLSGHDHGAASGNQHPGPGGKPTPQPSHLPQPGAEHHPGAGHQHGQGGHKAAHGQHNQPFVESLHKGSTISNQVQEQLNSMGAHYNTHQLYEVVGKTLQHNHLTYLQAHYLPAGYHTHLLHTEQIKEILEKSKS